MTPKRSRKSGKPAERDIVTEALIWNGVTIDVAYEADCLNSSEGSFPTSHLAITSVAPEREPLPITETGYRSHFLAPGIVEEAGGPASYVRAWLDHEAKSPAWHKVEQERRQLDLFG